MDWKLKLAEMKPTLPNKTAERRRLVGREVTLQKQLVATRVNPNVIRKRWKEIR